jgi:hypothetical protein
MIILDGKMNTFIHKLSNFFLDKNLDYYKP